MDIRYFTYILLASSIVFYLIPVKNIEKTTNNKDIALVVFEKPDMYTLTTDKTTRRVQADNVVRFKNRDEMYNVNMVLNEDVYESFRANEIISKNESLSLKGSVFYKKGDELSLKTNELFYDINEKLVYNDVPFEAKYYDSALKGTKLYIDTQNNIFKSKDINFELDVKNLKGK